MVNNLFGFPFFGGVQRPSHTLNVNVQDTGEALVIEGLVEGFNKEHLQIEFVRNGLLITAEKQEEMGVTTQAEESNSEAGEQSASVQPQTQQNSQTVRLERFVPVFFPFSDKDVTASFEENTLKVVVNKNEANRKFIPVN